MYVDIYMYVYEFLMLYIYVYVHVLVCVYIYILFLCTYIYTYICTYACTYTHTYTCIYIHIHIYVCVCVNTYIYKYLHTPIYIPINMYALSTALGETPGILLLITIVEGLNLLLAFPLGQFVRIARSEITRRHFDQPFWLDCYYVSHIPGVCVCVLERKRVIE